MSSNGVNEKDYRSDGRYDMDSRNHEPDDALRKIRTAGSISISPELFERIYLSPQNQVKGDLRKTFGNPTPVAIAGFLISLTPLTNILLEWRHSGGLGASGIATYFFFGGLLMILGGVLEFVLGNTFPFVVFTTFGAFWLSFGGTLKPDFNASAYYQPGAPYTSASDPEFAASFGFFLCYMGVLCFVYLIISIRTNIVFVGIFALLVPTFACLTMSFWKIAEGPSQAQSALNFQHWGGGLAFAVCLLGWYLFLSQLMVAVDFPISLPVGDLSTIVKGGSEIQKNKEARREYNADEEKTSGSKFKFWKRS